MKEALLWIVGGVVLLFVLLKTRAQNSSALSIGDISSTNGDFSTNLTNLGRIVNKITGGSAGAGSAGSAPTPLPGAPGGSGAAGGVRALSCYVNLAGESRCKEVNAGCHYEQPNGSRTLYLCCTRTNGNRSCTRIY